MNLIVGLGNPGNEYNFTRHNFGFLALDFYAKINNLTWQKDKYNAIWFKSQNNIFLKPQSFYNDSGIPTQAFAHFYKIPPSNILVVCDDFDLPFGQIRFREHGSSAGNNGLKSISKHLGTDQFPRLRLGTNAPSIRQKLGDIDFVLGHFAPEEKDQLSSILRKFSQKLDDYLKLH